MIEGSVCVKLLGLLFIPGGSCGGEEEEAPAGGREVDGDLGLSGG